ncbi:hypothetical protein [Paenibacillus sp. 22594]|uniref:hypothetical protein n=1 Tax=Paenibacillus sp. 22594 TaxID=3453947 RepID=UPI003F875F86
MRADELDWHIEQSNKLRDQAKAYDEDAPGAMIEIVRLLTAAYDLMGRISAQIDGDYEKLYTLRQNTFTLAKSQAKKGDKILTAELAVMDLRNLEAEAYEQKMYWRNERDSVKEKIYELRMRVRVEMQTGGFTNG